MYDSQAQENTGEWETWTFLKTHSTKLSSSYIDSEREWKKGKGRDLAKAQRRLLLLECGSDLVLAGQTWSGVQTQPAGSASSSQLA